MNIKFFLSAASIATFISMTSYGQWNINWQGSGQWGPNSSFVRQFDPKTVNIYQGTVEGVERHIPKKGMVYGILVRLKTDPKTTFNVLLGPAWYLENQDFRIEPHDQIEVIASKIIYDKKPLLIPIEITKGGATMRLRESNGYPLWCACRPQSDESRSSQFPQRPSDP